MVEWIYVKSIWLFRPDFADVLIGCQALEGFETPGEVIGHQECLYVLLQCVVRLVIVSFDRCFPQSPVHAFDLPVRPGMINFGQPVFDAKPRDTGDQTGLSSTLRFLHVWQTECRYPGWCGFCTVRLWPGRLDLNAERSNSRASSLPQHYFPRLRR